MSAPVLGFVLILAASEADVAQHARVLLNSKKYDEAARVIETAQKADATLAGASRLHFLRGLALQESARKPGADAAARAAAEAEYREAIRLDPKSGPALNNLADLLGGSGREQEAEALYRQAIDLNDDRKGYYALNAAKLVERRDPKEALRLAKLSANAAPNSDASREYFADLYAKHQPGALLPFAKNLVDAGRTKQALQLATKNLDEPRPGGASREAWLTLIAMTFAKDPVLFGASGEQDALEKLSVPADDPVSAGVKELQALRSGVPNLVWWKGRRERFPGLGTTGRGAMLALTRALGQASVANENLSAAEGYLRAAVDLGERGPDPDAFLDLVGLYAAKNDGSQISNLMKRYEFELFSEKGQAYVVGNKAEIYKLHLALGMTYAHLKAWKSTSPYQNASFQLDAAKKTADELNAEAKSEGRTPTTALPPIAVQKRSECYLALGDQKRAAQAKVEGAEQLLSVGRTRDATEIYNGITIEEKTALGSQFEERIQLLQRHRNDG